MLGAVGREGAQRGVLGVGAGGVGGGDGGAGGDEAGVGGPAQAPGVRVVGGAAAVDAEEACSK